MCNEKLVSTAQCLATSLTHAHTFPARVCVCLCVCRWSCDLRRIHGEKSGGNRSAIPVRLRCTEASVGACGEEQPFARL